MAQTIGQQLKQAREAHNLTIAKVVEATHIRARLLEAIEADDFESLPSPVQARAFLRLYAEYLGLSLDEMITRQRESLASSPEPSDENRSALIQDPALESGSEDNDPAISFRDDPDVPPGQGSQSIQRLWNGLIARVKTSFARSVSSPANQDLHEESNELVQRPEPEQSAELAENTAGYAWVASGTNDPKASHAIFTAIGQSLRQRRESLSLTLDEIERHTHVRKHYLLALEEGEFERLPSSVQTRGMLNNYARFLDMDVEALLLKFAEGLQIQRVERQPQPVEAQQKPAGRFSIKFSLPAGLRRFLSMDILVGGGLVLLLIIFAFWGTSRIIGLRSASTPQPTAPSISNILNITTEVMTSTPSATSLAGAGTEVPIENATAAIALPAAGTGAVQVVVVAQNSTWVRVVVDRKVQFDGIAAQGTAYPFDGNNQIEVLTGNGSAISILYNQSNLGTMGTLGEVVDRIYTANAILNPTATFTSTPTITPIPSITPRPSATLRPSITPRHSLTPTR
jgi:cytoskeleton protein RodZ